MIGSQCDVGTMAFQSRLLHVSLSHAVWLVDFSLQSSGSHIFCIFMYAFGSPQCLHVFVHCVDLNRKSFYLQICTCTQFNIYIYVYIYLFIYLFICMFICIHICIFQYFLYECIYTYVYIAINSTVKDFNIQDNTFIIYSAHFVYVLFYERPRMLGILWFPMLAFSQAAQRAAAEKAAREVLRQEC